MRYQLHVHAYIILILPIIIGQSGQVSASNSPPSSNPFALFSKANRNKTNSNTKKNQVNNDKSYLSVEDSENSSSRKNSEEVESTTDISPSEMNNTTQNTNSMKSMQKSSPHSMSSLLLSCISSVLFGTPIADLYQQNDQHQPPQIQVSVLSLITKIFLVGFALSRDNFLFDPNKAYMPPPVQHFMFERVNDRYQRDTLALRQALNPMPRRRGLWSNSRTTDAYTPTMKLAKKQLKKNDTDKKIAIVLELKTDNLLTSEIKEFCDSISFILAQYHSMFVPMKKKVSKRRKRSQNETETYQTKYPLLEVILILESPGGIVQDFGLLSTQLSRLRNIPNAIGATETKHNSTSPSPQPIQLTICVDTIAASGGYMLALQASPNSLFASPFAMVGSIGVINERINYFKLLKNYGVQSFVFASGEGKYPVGAFNEVTKEGQEIVQRSVDRVFDAFKDYVKEARNMTDVQVNKVATGEVWLGAQALELGLVDKIKTSDEYILEKILEDTLVLRLMNYESSKIGIGLGGFSLWDLLFLREKGFNKVKDATGDKFGEKLLKTISILGASGAAQFLLKYIHLGLLASKNDIINLK